jgi:hypothetical protein
MQTQDRRLGVEFRADVMTAPHQPQRQKKTFACRYCETPLSRTFRARSARHICSRRRLRKKLQVT